MVIAICCVGKGTENPTLLNAGMIAKAVQSRLSLRFIARVGFAPERKVFGGDFAPYQCPTVPHPVHCGNGGRISMKESTRGAIVGRGFQGLFGPCFHQEIMIKDGAVQH
jgi:hypothetical protein